MREEEKETKRDGQEKGGQKSAQQREIVGLLGEGTLELETFTADSGYQHGLSV